MSRRFWSDHVHGLRPYVPGEQPRIANLVKLNTNESPYPPSPGVRAALASIEDGDLMRYPDPRALALRDRVAQHFGLDGEQVFLGNGSDEVLAHVFHGLFRQPRELLFPDITYSFYPVWAQLYGVPWREIALRDDFTIDPSDYPATAAAVILPNPNAPTGRLLSLGAIERFLRDAPDRLLVVDEAYIDYGGESAAPLIASFDNLLVIQTLSKSRALAGLRVGFALGSKDLIEGLERVKDSFNSYPLDVVAQRAAAAAMADTAWYADACQRVIATRERFRAALEVLGFEVLPSAANFVFARHQARPGRELFAALREEGILVRRWDKPRIEDFLRISIGTDAQMDRVLEVLRPLLAEAA